MTQKPTRQFIERRKEYRLPYEARVLFSDESRSLAAHALNLSRGGVFIKTLDPYALESQGHVLFMLPAYSESLCISAKVVHIVFDRQRSEIDCGMGVQFLDLSDKHRSLLDQHIRDEQTAYLELKEILLVAEPDVTQVQIRLQRLPHLAGLDLLGLRYRVDRICTLFEALPGAETQQAS